MTGILLLLPFAAHAQKSADTLRVVWRDALPNVDPYFNNARTGLIVAHQAFDTLLYRDPETLRLKPLLAQSWKWADDLTLEFELRPGLKFHNGDPVTAADVVYTFNAVASPETRVSVPTNFLWIDQAEQIGELGVRVKLKRVFPAAVEYVAMVLPIWPKAYRERVGADAYAKEPVGAGPYRITRVDGVREIDLERFDGYYADSPKGRPAIRRIVIKEVPEESTQVTMLLGNQADWIWYFNADNFDSIARMPTLQAVRAESMRYGFISLDAAGRTGADNPLTKDKVRQAIVYAIDREAMAKQLMRGGSRVIDTPCYPTQFGCDAGAAMHYRYDPEKAKQLLSEAGYPNGFDTELVTYELPQWADAVQGYLKTVGINAKITQLQVAAEVQRSLAGQNPMELASWGSYSVNDVSAILPNFFTYTGNDYTRDPEIRKLVEAGGATVDPDQRRKAYTEAIKLITAKASWMPVFTYTVTYGYSKQLNFKPYADELPRFFLAGWK